MKDVCNGFTKNIFRSSIMRMMLVVLLVMGVAQVTKADNESSALANDSTSVANDSTAVANNGYWDDQKSIMEQPPYTVEAERYVFTISKASQLAWFANQYRQKASNVEEKKRYARAKLIITGDINLKGHYWRPIGKDKYPFEGEIQGNGKTISNIELNNESCAGFIASIQNSCTINNLKFNNCSVVNGGGQDLVGFLAGEIKNGDIKFTNLTFESCRSVAKKCAGILIGEVQGATSLTFQNIMIIKPRLVHDWGGGLLIGACNNVKQLKASDITIRGKLDYSNYTVESSSESSSCFIGFLNQCGNFSFSNVTFDGCVLNCPYKYCGILVGTMGASSGDINNVTVSNCEIIARDHCVGGLVGQCTNSNQEIITMDNCRVVGTKIAINKGSGQFGGLIGRAQGKWVIKNCFTEVDFGQNMWHDWGGLIGKTEGRQTSVYISNCISHINDNFFTSDIKAGGLVGLVGENSSVHIYSSGVLSGDFSGGKQYSGLLVGYIENGAALWFTNCFIDNRFKGKSKDELRKLAFSTKIYNNAGQQTTFGDIYPLLVNTNEESSYVSYNAAWMNELDACLGVQSHGSASNHRRQYLPLTDPLKGMVVRFSDAGNVEKVKSTHMQESYGIYKGSDNTYAMMTLGDTNIVQLKPLDNKWYININNGDTAVSYKARKESYIFHIALKNLKDRTKRKFNIDLANIPKVQITGQYDPIRQRVSLSWIPFYIAKDDHDKLKNDFKWAIYRGTTLLTDSLPLDSCHYIDLTPDMQKDQDKTLNKYSIALVSKSMFLTAKDEHASNSHANCQVYASDKIELDIKGEQNLDGVQLSTEIPNSKRFDSCQVNLYRWDVATGLTIISNIKTKQSKISEEDLIKAFADSVRSGRSGVKKVAVRQFKFNAALKDSLVKVTCQDNITDFSTNYFYVFCCENFHDSYYKQFKAFFSKQYMYIPSTKVMITDLTCNKGESDSKTSVTWKSKLSNSSMNVRYRVYRKLYKEEDSNLELSIDTVGWEMRYEVTNSYLTNTYTDEALPGYVYRYRVNAYLAVNNEFNYEFIAANATDIGYTSGRGTILGKITYASGGSRVKGVDVALTTDKESMKDLAVKPKARQFFGGNDYLPLASGLSSDFWSGDWTVQFILRPTKNGRLVSIPGTMAVVYENGKLSMAGKQMQINANGFNYIIIKHSGSNKSYQLGYASRPATNASNVVYAHYAAEVKDADMKDWMTKQGEKTVTNVLAFGCISDSASTKIKGHHSFAGLLDEVRVWNKQLTEEEVRITFDRYITGYELGLMAYYTFDDGVRDNVYDISHTANGEPNNHHAKVVNRDVNQKQFHPDVVTLASMDSVLCYRGTTDENGQYQVAGVPYCGEGTNFMVQPIYGTHEFYPTQIRRYVSKSSLVHQDVDFTDQSSFRVPVMAQYSGTTMPVQGLVVLVDDLPAKSTDGSVMTDAEGQATVSVPIGKHKLRLYAKGHEMANDGYACDITVDDKGNVTVKKSPLLDQDGYMDFQQDLVAPLTFYDNTRVALCGHAVGGSVENSKLMGDKTKINNIGPVTITLAAENLERSKFIKEDNVTSRDYSHFSAAMGVNCKVIYNKSSIVITTNDDKGEYLAMLPPIAYKVVHVQSTNVMSGQTALGDTDFELDKIETSLHFDVTKKYSDVVTTNAKGSVIDAKTYAIVDSLVIDSIVSLAEIAQEVDSTISSNSENESNATTTAFYHLKKNFAYYVEPTLEVYNAAMKDKNDSLMMGEETVKVGKNDDETLTIWNATQRDGKSGAYNLKMTYQQDGKPVTTGFPVFKMGTNYRLKIKLYDNYVNRQTGKATHYDLSKVPISFVNGLASKGFSTLVTNAAEQLPDTFSYTTIGDSVTANTASNGVLEYVFTAGFPNAVYPYTQKLEISYEANNRIYTMEKPIEGIVIGAVPIPGKDFVTKGPKIVDLVLRDPPGSGSYSWIDAGSTIGNTYTHTHSGGADGGNLWSFGKIDATDEEVSEAEEELGIIKKVYYYEDTFKDVHDHGFTISLTGSGSTTKTVNYTFNDKLQTSASAGYVGEDGDIYIGRGMNIIFSKTREISFHKTTLSSGSGVLQGSKNNHYQLNETIGLAGSIDSIETTFAYTQKHIVNTLIPQLRQQRRNLCTVVDDFSNLPTSVDSTSYFVLRNVSDDMDEWVSDTDYVCVFSAAENQTDMVSVSNSWIDGWKNAIEKNEKTKYETYIKYGSKKTGKYKDNTASNRFTPEVEYGYLGNISLDGGSSKTTTLSRSYTDNQTNSVAWTVKVNNVKNGIFASKNSIGGEQVNYKLTINPNVSGNYSWTNNKTYTQNLGYTISDATGGDYISVSTYLPAIELTKAGDKNFVTDRPSFKEFFVFRLIGGQTRCPYEGPKQSLYYRNDTTKQPVLLSNGSIPVEVPQIKLDKHIISGVPNGRSVTVSVVLSNTSTATITLAPWYPTFNLQMLPRSNPSGLQLIVDGATIGSSALPLTLGPGQSITKTLEFKQTRLDILDYKNIVFGFYSDCQSTNGVYDSLTIQFKPASSPVTLMTDAQYVNKTNVAGPVNFIIQDYEPTFENFVGIRLQRKRRDVNEAFTTVGNIINKKRAEQFGIAIPAGAVFFDSTDVTKKVTLPIMMKDISDAIYIYRAVSYSKYSTEEIQTISDTLTIIKDTGSPALFGKPTPADGYYSGESEIALLFNEAINTSLLSPDNVTCTGAINDAILTHNSGLHFDGNAPAKTSARVNILGKSTTVGFWYKPQMGKRSCLFSQQIVNKENKSIPIALYYNADGTMTVYCGGDSVKSEKKSEQGGHLISDWMYAILTINRSTPGGKDEIILYNLFGTSKEDQSLFIKLQDTSNVASYDYNVPLYIGGSAMGDPCYADIESFVVYDDYVPFAQASANKSIKQISNVRGLRAYWPMDEGHGDIAHDKVFSRNLTLQTADGWYTPVSNYALNLNGTSQYLSLNTSAISITQPEDYTIEMWFRSEGNETKDMALFSCGYGGNTKTKTEVDARKHVSLLLGTNGQIIFNATGKTYEFGKGYNDQKWHHLALNVPRDGYVSVLVDTIDITNVSILGDSLGSLERTYMQVGALVYSDATGNDKTSDYFKGRIDEVRIWNAMKTTTNIKANVFTRLSGGEAGLVAYYPFEYDTVSANQQVTKTTLQDRAKADNYPGFKPAGEAMPKGFNGVNSLQMNGAVLRSAGCVVPVTIDYTTNGKDKIIISFPATLAKYRIEGCTLNFQVKDVKDLAGNTIVQPVNWSVYVRQNTLRWVADDNNLQSDISGSDNTTVYIYNDSKTTQQWRIVNVPSWLHVSQQAGFTEPFGFSVVSLNSMEGTSIGNYASTMYLIGTNDSIYEPLEMNLAVTAEQPDWSVYPTKGAIWMSVMGRLKIGDTWCTDVNSIVSVVDEQNRCLALASPEYNEQMSTYFVHLNVKGNDDMNSKKLYFRVWDASTGVIYEKANISYGNYSQNYHEFKDKAILGDFTQPCVISAADNISQTLTLHYGWNWISMWVSPTAGSTADKVFAPIKDYITEIKTPTGGKTPKQFGTLTLNPANSYHIYLNQEATLAIEGKKVDPAGILMKLNHPQSSKDIRWNWIGFPLWKMMTLGEAFADFTPVTNDVVKSEDSYAMFNGNSWIGDLKYLTPGTGYIYGYHGVNGQDSTWHYPSNVKTKVNANGFTLDCEPSEYEDYTFVDVSVVDGSGNLITGFDYQLAAFVEVEDTTECCGVADGVSGESCPISIFGEDGETYTFKLYNKSNGQVYDLVGTKEYDNITSPQTLRLSLTTTDNANVNANADDDGDYYSITGVKIDVSTVPVPGVYVKKGGKVLKTNTK